MQSQHLKVTLPAGSFWKVASRKMKQSWFNADCRAPLFESWMAPLSVHMLGLYQGHNHIVNILVAQGNLATCHKHANDDA